MEQAHANATMLAAGLSPAHQTAVLQSLPAGFDSYDLDSAIGLINRIQHNTNHPTNNQPDQQTNWPYLGNHHTPATAHNHTNHSTIDNPNHIQTADGSQFRTSPNLDSLTNQAWDAWRINPYARRIVEIHIAHIVGRQFRIRSDKNDINKYVQAWWDTNKIDRHIYDWVREYLITGEWFFGLFSNQINGFQTVRLIPSCAIGHIETSEHDWMDVLSYKVNGAGDGTDQTFKHVNYAQRNEKAMMHCTLFNRVGKIRGEGGILDPVLASLARYQEFIKARIAKSRAASEYIRKIKASSPERREQLEALYRGRKIQAGSIYIYEGDEDIENVSSPVNGFDASYDGKLLKQNMGAGAGLMPHHLGDPEGSTQSTAREASFPVSKMLSVKQKLIVTDLTDLAEYSVIRAKKSGKFGRRYNQNLPKPGKWCWRHDIEDITRQDNQILSQAALTITNMCAVGLKHGLIDEPAATELIMRFAGESNDTEPLLERLYKTPSDKQIFDEEMAYSNMIAMKHGGRQHMLFEPPNRNDQQANKSK